MLVICSALQVQHQLPRRETRLLPAPVMMRLVITPTKTHHPAPCMLITTPLLHRALVQQLLLPVLLLLPLLPAQVVPVISL
jgi:hypothetical protein